MADRSVSVPMTLSDLERRGVRGQKFLGDLHIYARTVWPWMTKFGTAKQVREKHMLSLGVSHVPIPWARGPIVPKFFGTPTNVQTVWHRATKFDAIIHVGQRVFLGDHTCPSPKAAGTHQLNFLSSVFLRREPQGGGPQHPQNFWDLIHARTQSSASRETIWSNQLNWILSAK